MAAVSSLFSRPFFEEKSRAFWILQAAGWSGYLLLRTVSSVFNAPTAKVVLAVIVESIVGYCLTLLMSVLYGSYRRLPRAWAVIATLVTLFAATLLYAVIEAYTFSLFRATTATRAWTYRCCRR